MRRQVYDGFRTLIVPFVRKRKKGKRDIGGGEEGIRRRKRNDSDTRRSKLVRKRGTKPGDDIRCSLLYGEARGVFKMSELLSSPQEEVERRRTGLKRERTRDVED